MKRYGWFLLLLAAAAPVFAASSITVDQLKQKLDSMHQSYKDDAEVATWLKEVTLSEQLTQSDRVGGRVAPAVLPHHRTCGSASGGS